MLEDLRAQITHAQKKMELMNFKTKTLPKLNVKDPVKKLFIKAK